LTRSPQLRRVKSNLIARFVYPIAIAFFP